MSARVSALPRAPLEEEGCTGECGVCRRLRLGVLSALARRGVQALDATDVAAEAGLQRADLVAHYGDVESCLAAAYDELAEQLHALHVAALDGPGDWQSRFTAGVRAALDLIASTPGAARLAFSEELIAHPDLRIRRAAAMQRIARLVADELEHEQERSVPALQIEFLLGAVSHAAQCEAATGLDPARVAARVSQTLRLLEPQAV